MEPFSARISSHLAHSLWAVVLSVTLGGCVAAPAPAQPTAAPAPPTTAPIPATATAMPPRPTEVVVVAPTPTFERVREAEPTVGAVLPTGMLSWRDEVQNNDGLLVLAEDLPALANNLVYAAWLQGVSDSLFLGVLGGDATVLQPNARSLTFASPEHANLLDGFHRVTITRANPSAASSTQPTDPVLVGALPEKALVHVRHVLVSIDSTPAQLGFALGVRKETDLVLIHAQFLRDAVTENNLANLRFHAEHLVNIVEGKQGEHYGDLSGNGRVENPGDGFGLLAGGDVDGYIKGMSDHAGLAASSADATDGIKLHASHVAIAGENTRVRLSEIRDLALEVGKARQPADASSSVLRILALAQQTIRGVDLNGDEQIAPVRGEGGVLTAYQHAQLMAGIPLTRPQAAIATGPTAVPKVQPTVAPKPVATVAPTVVAQAPAQPAEVRFADDEFNPKTINVAVGTTVVWRRSGTRPHTVTADDGSFNSGLLRGTDAFEVDFKTAGAFAYYCELHGGPGGAGMSGVVNVR